MNIKEILKKSNELLIEKNINESFLKSRILLANVLNVKKEYLITHDDEEIPKDLEKDFLEKVGRLMQGEPIQYITNFQEFMGLEFYVDENVLIPQPDTEILVEKTIKLVNEFPKENQSEINILDLCTGSGAIAISLWKNLQDVKLVASDISEKALDVAIKNANLNSAKITFVKSDLFDNINEKFDIIVSNPPYIETAEIESLSDEVKCEPKIALDGGIDGLDFYRKITKQAKKILNKNGLLAVEIGYNQRLAVEKMFIDNGFKNIQILKDLNKIDRVVIGEK